MQSLLSCLVEILLKIYMEQNDNHYTAIVFHFFSVTLQVE